MVKNMKHSADKFTDYQMNKVLHEPIALYLTLTYNILVSLVQGFALGAIFYIITIQQNLDISLCKIIISFGLVIFIWHGYILHNQYIVIRASIFDTLIPVVLGVCQCALALAINQPIYIFTLLIIPIIIMLDLALLNAYIKNKDPLALEIFKEHYKKIGPQFAKDLHGEIRNFEKQSIYNTIYVIIFLIILSLFIYLFPLNLEIKTYISTIIVGILIILMSYYDLNQFLNNSKKLEKYGYKW